MTFDIRQFISIPPHRSSGNVHIPCPSCQASDTRNPALSINLDTGAYHCFKCEGEKTGDIRTALGENKERVVPSVLAQSPSKDITVSLGEVVKNHQQLMSQSKLAKGWLLNRGFTQEIISHYQLGVKRVRRLDKMWWGVSIPIPTSCDRTRYFQKIRLQPWLIGDDRPRQLPSWDQKGIHAQTWFTWLPDGAIATYLCEGEWDAMLLGWQARQNNSTIAVATFTCGCDTVPPLLELSKLPGKVTIFYDRNDNPNGATGERPGEKGAIKVALALTGQAAIALVPQRPEHANILGWDVSDAINAGFSFDDFVAAATNAITPAPPSPPKTSNPLEARVITNKELMARAPDYIDWLVADMLPMDELFVLAASARSGKSLLAMLLAQCVATGNSFLGRVVTQGSVLYVNLEDSETKIKQRQLAQEWEEDLPIYWLDRFKLSDVGLLREIAQKLDVKLIVLDTLSRIRDDNSLESSAEISRHLEPLQNMAQELRLAVLLIHHTVKISLDNANKVDVFETIRGSGAIRAVCRGSWILAAGDRVYRLCVEHGYGEKQDLEVLLDPEKLAWRAVRPWNPKSNSTQVEQILNHLKVVGSATIPYIASALNLNPNYVTNALWRLQTAEMVRKEPGKKFYPAIYHITEKAAEIESTSVVNDIALPLDGMELQCNHDPYIQRITDDVNGFHTN